MLACLPTHIKPSVNTLSCLDGFCPCLFAQAEELRRKEADRLARGRKLAEDTKAANAALQTFRLQEQERAKEQERAIEGKAGGRQGTGPTGREMWAWGRCMEGAARGVRELLGRCAWGPGASCMIIGCTRSGRVRRDRGAERRGKRLCRRLLLCKHWSCKAAYEGAMGSKPTRLTSQQPNSPLPVRRFLNVAPWPPARSVRAQEGGAGGGAGEARGGEAGGQGGGAEAAGGRDGGEWQAR